MRATILLGGLVALTALPACSVIRGRTRSKGEIIFSHTQHVAQADCADCHGEVPKSQGPTRGAFIPRGHAGCASCHELEIKNRCDLCHRGKKEGVELRRVDRKLRFAHSRHENVDCATCHPKDKQGGAFVPGHPTCNVAGCHRVAYKALECGRCHQDLQRFRGQPSGFLVHGADFAREHGKMARQASRACAQCHDQTYCAECHQAGTALARPSILWPEKVDRGFIHRGDWESRHMIEARAEPQSCYRCHGQRSCRACHALAGVAAPVSTSSQGGITRHYHPTGWQTPGSAQFHGTQARREIGRCASCHDRGGLSNCVGCHKVGGVGGNPHPVGWNRRDKLSECYTSSMCATCHPAGQGCRR
jgi:hypothetical protein